MWDKFGQQLYNPTGFGGRLVGHLMTAANRRAVSAAIAALGVDHDDAVLDLGCGAGDAVARLARRASQGLICGIDQSRVMVDMARRRNRAAIAAGRVRIDRGGFAVLPYRDGQFDRVLACNVAYFWYDDSQILGEVRRVMKPGGTLSIYVTDRESMRDWPFLDPARHRLFGRDDLVDMVSAAGADSDGLSVDTVAVGAGTTGLLLTCRFPRADGQPAPPTFSRAPPNRRDRALRAPQAACDGGHAA
jgi:SAM-dependent methyltransferase